MQLYQNKNKKSLAKYITRLFRYCYRHRSDWIRTSGLLVPNQALYRTEPHPDCLYIISQRRGIVNSIRQKISISVSGRRYNVSSSSSYAMILHKYSVSSKKLSSRITRSILSFAVHPPYFTIRILLYTVKRVSVARYPL